MKKKILGVGIILILIAMLFTLAGCVNKGEEQKDNSSSKESLASKVKVGDYVSYNAGDGNTYTSTKGKNGSKDQTFKTIGTEKWRVLSIEDDGTVNLISDKGIRSTNNTAYELLKGKGYANGIEELNNICAIYGKGEGAISARSMTYEDAIRIIGIDKWAEYFNSELSNYKNEDEKIEKILELLAKKNKDKANSNYGEVFTVTDSSYMYAPDLNNENGYSKVESLKAKDNYIYITHIEAELINDKDTMSLLVGAESGTGCWLATTFEQKNNGSWSKDESKNYVGYGLYYTASDLNILRNSSIEPAMIFTSSNSNIWDSTSYCIRPVVTLDKNTTVSFGDGSVTTPYQIK